MSKSRMVFVLGLVMTLSGSALACVGDCDGDGQVTSDDVTTQIGIALGTTSRFQCPALRRVVVTIDHLVLAVNRTLNG